MDRALRVVVAGLPVFAVLGLILLARFRPGYFTNPEYLTGMIFLQILALCLWLYDRLFFPFLMMSFFWAGMDVPMSGAWTLARWVVLGAGAFVGFVRSLRLGRQRYNAFHLVALACVVCALVSAMVSALPGFAALKALSVFLLFLYGSAGARLVLRDPERFFRGLVLACEINVYVTALFYFIVGREIWGNSNSLGAVEGVVAAPLLLWGALVTPSKNLRLRWGAACLGALYLVYFSITRAALVATMASMLVLLVGLRRQRLLVQGLIGTACVVAGTALVLPSHFQELKTSFTEGVIYKGHQAEGLLGSRLTPWQKTVQVIQTSPYFGSGFGTSLLEEEAFGEAPKFFSTSETNREHGSSYLAITEWMGLVGVVPFALLIFLVILAVGRVYVWMRQTGSASHYSVPLMMVLVAGLTHALFEDWMFAAGSYVAVLFWSFAFLLIDLVPQPAQQTKVVEGVRLQYSPTGAGVRQ